jgi:hypothetical protein
MVMDRGTQNILFIVLAVIGAIVVGGWLLKIAFKLLGLVIVIGLCVVAYIVIQNMVGKGR